MTDSKEIQQNTQKEMSYQEFEQKLKELNLKIKDFCDLIGISPRRVHQYKLNLKPIPLKVKIWLEKYQLEKELEEEEKTKSEKELFLHNKVCKTLNIDKQELANMLGLSVHTIYAWSDSERISIQTKLTLELLLENHKLSQMILNLQEAFKFINTIHSSITINKKLTKEE
ncbi:hypothetical protein CC21_05360 [Campylobacter upsaliensis]|nr:hypothetical protein [Campylobacter upsaliensis]